MTADRFHHAADCAQVITYGPRGGPHFPRTEEWRRNGATQTWRTRPDEYRVPVKYGLRSYGALIEGDGAPFGPWHTGRAEDCELGALAPSMADYLAVYAAALAEYRRTIRGTGR
jgi:hypothetical protein